MQTKRYRQKYYQEHKEHHRKICKDWMDAHPGKSAQYSKRYHMEKK